MGLADIFGKGDGQTQGPNADPLARVATSVAAHSELPVDLANKASIAAEAADRASEASSLYKMRREELLREVEQELAPLKDRVEQTAQSYDTVRQELIEDMDAAGVSRLPMLDRDPIRIKTTKGRKRNITKKWLTSEFGKQTAESIWDRAPSAPDSRDLVIPPPYNDQPSD